MSQVIRAQYRAVIQKEAAPEKTEQAFAYWEEQLKKQCLEGGVLTGTMCRYQDQLFFVSGMYRSRRAACGFSTMEGKDRKFCSEYFGKSGCVGNVAGI